MKRRSIYFSCLLLVLLSFTQVDGQVKKKAQVTPKPQVEATPKPSPPVMVEKATTETGKLVLLKSDGTWEYDTAPRPAPVATPTPIDTKVILRFKAAVITRAGTVIPAARGSFSLLDEDLRTIVATKAAAKLNSSSSLDRATAYMTSQDYDLIKPHIIAKTTTDFEGNGTFEVVEAKTYYIYFFDFIGQNSVLWSFKIDLKPGDNYVVLDQNNALETFSR